jgi:Mrp family chromosome partitioning ATPase
MFGEGSAGEGLLQHLSAAKSSGQFGAVEILPSLWVMPSGGTSGDAQELLSTEQFASLIDTSAREFDLTIIDTPPANRYADAQRIASVARYCVIVARSDRTYYRDVEELTGQLQADGVTIVGTVFNQH